MAVVKFGKKKGEAEDLPYAPPPDALPPAEEGEAWLISYADMMTLLCGFFIMMFSMSKLDTPEYEGMREAVAKEFQGKFVSPSRENAKFLTQIIQEAGVEGDAVIKSDAFGVSITFSSTVFFDTLSSDLKPDALTAVTKIMDGIAAQEQNNQKHYKIVIEGHTDSRPILGGSFPSNWELSGSRAARVVRLFLEKGFKAQNLTAIGYADTYPETAPRNADGSWNEQALNKNRRVVIRVLEPLVDGIPFPGEQRAPASTDAATPTEKASTGSPTTAPPSEQPSAQPTTASPTTQSTSAAPTAVIPTVATPAPITPATLNPPSIVQPIGPPVPLPIVQTIAPPAIAPVVQPLGQPMGRPGTTPTTSSVPPVQ